MATTLALAMRASMSAGGVVAGANEAASALDKMGRHAAKAASDVSVLKNLSLGDMAAKGISALTNALQSAGNAVASYVASVTNAVDATNDLAERTGMNVESLQGLQMAAKLSGIDDVTSAVQKLAVSIGKAAESGDTKAFARLGLDLDKLRSMSPDEQFRAVQKAIASLPSTADKAAAAVALFGRSGVEMLPLFNRNVAEIEERMQRLGAIVGTDQVAAIGEMNDALDMVKATFAGIIGQVAGNLAPIVTEIANTFLEFVEGFKSVNGEGGTGVANAITEGLLDFVDALAHVIDVAVSNMDAIAATLKATSKVVGFVFKNLSGIREARGLLGFASAASQLNGGPADTTASDFVKGLRNKFRESQTPEAKARRQAEQQARDQGRQAAMNAAEEGGESAKEAAEALRKEAQRVFDETRTAEEKHAAAVAKLDDMRARNVIDEQTYLRARKAEDDKLQELRDRDADRVRQAQEKAAREAEQAQQKERQRMEKIAAVDEKIAGKQDEIDKIAMDKATALGSKSNESLKANDIRSSEGMAQFLALASGREDPAIEENRKTNAKLEEIRKELRALQQEKVDILGAAA